MDTLRFSASLYPPLFGFVATGALAVMTSLIPGWVGMICTYLVLLLGSSYFTLQTYGLSLILHRRSLESAGSQQIGLLHRQILPVWMGYVGWWILFVGVLAVVSYGLKLADSNVTWMLSFLPDEGLWRGIAALLLLLSIRGVLFWFFETNHAFLGLAKMSGSRGIVFAHSLTYGQRKSLFLSLLVAILPLLMAGTIFDAIKVFSINGLGLGFILNLPLPVTGFLGFILGYCFVLSVFIRTRAFLSVMQETTQG